MFRIVVFNVDSVMLIKTFIRLKLRAAFIGFGNTIVIYFYVSLCRQTKLGLYVTRVASPFTVVVLLWFAVMLRASII